MHGTKRNGIVVWHSHFLHKQPMICWLITPSWNNPTFCKEKIKSESLPSNNCLLQHTFFPKNSKTRMMLRSSQMWHNSVTTLIQSSCLPFMCEQFIQDHASWFLMLTRQTVFTSHAHYIPLNYYWSTMPFALLSKFNNPLDSPSNNNTMN